MQKYWTATSAAVACEELLNEPREKADSHKEFFSNILPNISIEGNNLSGIYRTFAHTNYLVFIYRSKIQLGILL
jgi:hypothetical protein